MNTDDFLGKQFLKGKGKLPGRGKTNQAVT